MAATLLKGGGAALFSLLGLPALAGSAAGTLLLKMISGSGGQSLPITPTTIPPGDLAPGGLPIKPSPIPPGDLAPAGGTSTPPVASHPVYTPSSPGDGRASPFIDSQNQGLGSNGPGRPEGQGQGQAGFGWGMGYDDLYRNGKFLP
jgi:hypothetical protein